MGFSKYCSYLNLLIEVYVDALFLRFHELNFRKKVSKFITPVIGLQVLRHSESSTPYIKDIQ